MNLTGLAERAAGRLVRGRAAALALMTSRVTVMRGGALGEQDEETGRQVRTWTEVALDVPFKLDGSSSGDGGTRTVTVDGVSYQQATGVGHLPHDQALADDDLLLVTAGPWTGSVYRVIEAVKLDHATARRVPIVEVPAPSEWSA